LIIFKSITDIGISHVAINEPPVDYIAQSTSIFPNPVKEDLHIICTGFKTENGVIEILSLDGKEILRKKIRKGNDNIELDLGDLETGMYLCQISIGNKVLTKKIIKE